MSDEERVVSDVPDVPDVADSSGVGFDADEASNARSGEPEPTLPEPVRQRVVALGGRGDDRHGGR